MAIVILLCVSIYVSVISISEGVPIRSVEEVLVPFSSGEFTGFCDVKTEKHTQSENTYSTEEVGVSNVIQMESILVI